MIWEIRFEAEGRTWVLCYSANALVAIEEALGVSTAEFGKLLEGMSVKTLRTVFRCGLIDNHADLDDSAAGRLAPVVQMGQLVGRAVDAAFASEQAPPRHASHDMRPGNSVGNGDARPLAPGERTQRGSRPTAPGANAGSTQRSSGGSRPGSSA